MFLQFRSLILLNLLSVALLASSAQAADIAEPILPAPSNFKLTKIDGPDPRYPRRAMENGQNGWVDLRFTVSPDGQVENVQVTDAEPRRVFERSALRAANKWVFEAPIDSGITTTISGVYRVRFVSQ